MNDCKLINLYKIKTSSGKDLSFLDEQKAKEFAANKGDWGENLYVYPEQILVVNGIQYFKVVSLNSEEVIESIKRAKVIEKLSEDEMKVLGLI